MPLSLWRAGWGAAGRPGLLPPRPPQGQQRAVEVGSPRETMRGREGNHGLFPARSAKGLPSLGPCSDEQKRGPGSGPGSADEGQTGSDRVRKARGGPPWVMGCGGSAGVGLPRSQTPGGWGCRGSSRPLPPWSPPVSETVRVRPRRLREPGRDIRWGSHRTHGLFGLKLC